MKEEAREAEPNMKEEVREAKPNEGAKEEREWRDVIAIVVALVEYRGRIGSD